MEKRKVYRSEFVEGVWNAVLVVAVVSMVFLVVYMGAGAA
jgi:hypothetical protein